jgi:hypothetical protein
VWCQGLVGRFDYQHSCAGKDVRSVVRELLHWCEESPVGFGHGISNGSGIARRQLDTGSLYHQLVQCLPSAVVNATDVSVLNEFISDWHVRRPDLPTVTADLLELMKKMPVASLVDELSQVAHQQTQRRYVRTNDSSGSGVGSGFGSGNRVGAGGVVGTLSACQLSALTPALRAKEPVGKKSTLRTYQSRYRDVKGDIKKAASIDVKRSGVTLTKPIPNVEGTNDILAVLVPLLKEISLCRQRLIDSGRFNRK